MRSIARGGDEWDEGYVTFFREESNKESVCDEKVKRIKLEGGTAAPPAPVAGESLNHPDENKLFLRSLSAFPHGRAAHALR